MKQALADLTAAIPNVAFTRRLTPEELEKDPNRTVAPTGSGTTKRYRT